MAETKRNPSYPYNKYDPRPSGKYDNHHVVFMFQQAERKTEFVSCLESSYRGDYLEEILGELERRGCTYTRDYRGCYTVKCPRPARDMITREETRNERISLLTGCLMFFGFKLGIPLGIFVVASQTGVSPSSLFVLFFAFLVGIAATRMDKPWEKALGGVIALGIAIVALFVR